MTTCVFSWEEDPRIEEHNKLTDYLLELADEQTGAKEYEKKAIEEKEQKELQRFKEKTWRWRKKYEKSDNL